MYRKVKFWNQWSAKPFLASGTLARYSKFKICPCGGNGRHTSLRCWRRCVKANDMRDRTTLGAPKMCGYGVIEAALRLGRSALIGVGVQVPLPAPSMRLWRNWQYAIVPKTIAFWREGSMPSSRTRCTGKWPSA